MSADIDNAGADINEGAEGAAVHGASVRIRAPFEDAAAEGHRGDARFGRGEHGHKLVVAPAPERGVMRKGVLGSGNEGIEDLVRGIAAGLIAKHPKATEVEERYPGSGRAGLAQQGFDGRPIKERAALEGGRHDG